MLNFAQGWYAILATNEIRTKPLAITRFGQRLVVWKTSSNEIVVMDDICPHRSAQLSLGTICDDNIVCPFHGFRFNAKGDCTYAPEFKRPLNGVKVKTVFKTQIACNMLWIYWGNTQDSDLQITPLLSIHENFKTFTYLTSIWKAHITRCIENQLDYTHVPHLHRTTIGRMATIPENPYCNVVDNVIKFFQDENSTTPTTEYVFPNAWILNISNKMKLLVYFVPLNEQDTKFYVYTYRNFLTLPLFNGMFSFFNRLVLRQDQKVVESQIPQITTEAHNELLMRHDQLIKFFRKMWSENLIS
jgi:phenylpropionate dioxygenase-like ring-hydroxylating dioxygenase large terminal subunit